MNSSCPFQQRWTSLMMLLTLLLCTTHNYIHAFAPIARTGFLPTSASPSCYYSSQLFNQENNNNDSDSNANKEIPMSFEDATAKLKEEEEAIKLSSRGMMLEEDAQRYQEKRATYDAMREQIRSRASNLNMNKSVATQEAIKMATQKAMAGESSAPTVDLSKLSDNIMGEPEEELTEEQMKEIDKVGQLSLWEQVLEEAKNTKFPSPEATLKQAALMVVIFVVTATLILKADELLRYQYTEWGFIPRAGEVLDYSDLTLPEGFTDQMTDDDLSNL
jgi:hypothetical protein